MTTTPAVPPADDVAVPVRAGLTHVRSGVRAGTFGAGDSRADATELMRLRQEVDGLRTAMQSRAAIEQAKGILVARYRISPDTAFAVLVRWSQRRNVKVRVISEALLALAQHGSAAAGPDRRVVEWLRQQLAEPSPTDW